MESRLKLNNIQTISRRRKKSFTQISGSGYDRNELIGWTDSGEAWVLVPDDVEKKYNWIRAKTCDFPTIEHAQKETK